MNKCPRCNCETSGQNRLVTDSCGHQKCRQCLLADVAECLECNANATNASKQPELLLHATEAASNSHISSNAHGYHCAVCDKSFRSRTQQYYHRACGNEMLKKFNCKQCNRRFATSSHLRYHQNSHNQSSSYSCNACGKAFKQQLLLQRHLRTHKPKAYACQDCPNLFHTQRALNVHALLHSGDSLLYTCLTCSKQYRTKANLKQHRLKHDQNSRRHSCSVCQKSFLRQSTLRLHQKRHTKRVRHGCSQCHKTFNDVDSLTRHMKHHTATQRYRCTQCEVIVNRRDNMLRHLRSMHPGVEFEAGVSIVNPEPSIQPTAATGTAPAQTLRHNSVIKSVGNVEPVNVAIAQPELELVEQPTVAVAAAAAVAALPDKLQKENVKLYRKIILDLDNEEYSNELSSALDMDATAVVVDVQQVTLEQPQRVPVHGSSNFSERHWRKNVKYLYENEHTN